MRFCSQTMVDACEMENVLVECTHPPRLAHPSPPTGLMFLGGKGVGWVHSVLFTGDGRRVRNGKSFGRVCPPSQIGACPPPFFFFFFFFWEGKGMYVPTLYLGRPNFVSWSAALDAPIWECTHTRPKLFPFFTAQRVVTLGFVHRVWVHYPSIAKKVKPVGGRGCANLGVYPHYGQSVARAMRSV